MEKSKELSEVNSLLHNVYDPVKRAKGAAEYLGISVSKFWVLVRKGELPKGVKVSNRTTVWRLSTLNAYLESKGV